MLQALNVGPVEPTADERARANASALLQKHLGQGTPTWLGPTKLELNAPSWMPRVDNVVESSGDDPQGDLAALIMQRQYPNLFKGVGRVVTGRPMPKYVAGFTTPDIGNGGARIDMRPSNGNFNDALDTLRHELGHVAGLGDVATQGTPTAYQLDHASSQLHQDIKLPAEKKTK